MQLNGDGIPSIALAAAPHIRPRGDIVKVWEAEQIVTQSSMALDPPSVVYRLFGQPRWGVERGVAVAVARLAALNWILDALAVDAEFAGSSAALAGRLGVNIDAAEVALGELTARGHLRTEARSDGQVVVHWADGAPDRHRPVV
jgi:hypothetical protein